MLHIISPIHFGPKTSNFGIYHSMPWTTGSQCPYILTESSNNESSIDELQKDLLDEPFKHNHPTPKYSKEAVILKFLPFYGEAVYSYQRKLRNFSTQGRIDVAVVVVVL